MADRPNDGLNPKQEQLEPHKESSQGEFLTTNTGARLENDQDTLRAGERGPSLLEDFHFREKLTHFDHERIPERVVHARGFGAHGYFQVYEPQSALTKAHFLQDPSVQTPVFVRFSTVAGSRGSSDLARDVRGFAVKFYTQEGNFDLVGNNIPVFFIQDAMKFPDLIHAAKPEPRNEIPQAQTAHDNFWDFISLSPEAAHMVMWVMSDRAIPRSFRMMEGFGVHTFRLVNDAGQSHFVKFHWKPKLGVHSVVWDEALKISGMDPDFHRRDLWEAIENGDYPEWELGIQVVNEEDEDRFEFDLLDATKIIPEELVPVQRIGRLVLNRNTDNFFAETEQAAFHVGHVVPGIDFTNDPLLQGRLFSYTDTQLIRLGGPNFQEIPINRPVAPVHNNQRDGYMRQTINTGDSSYNPNSVGGNYPQQAPSAQGGYVHYPQELAGPKIRRRGPKFFDHFSQATLFYRSMSATEQAHIVNALQFELGHVGRREVKERMLLILSQIDAGLAERVAVGLGLAVPSAPAGPLNHQVPADGNPADYQPRTFGQPSVDESPALSQMNQPKDSVQTRRVAVLASDGVDDQALTAIVGALTDAGARPFIVAPHGGLIQTAGNVQLMVDFTLLGSGSVLFDAVYVTGGAPSVAALLNEAKAHLYVREAFNHCKTIGADGEGVELLQQGDADGGMLSGEGVVTAPDGASNANAIAFVEALKQHRHWSRETGKMLPA